MDITMNGRAAIVTGGSKGIGFAIATRFASSGADVAIVARGQEALDALTRAIVNKIAHGPITELRRNAAHPEGHHFVNVIRKVFRLEQQ